MAVMNINPTRMNLKELKTKLIAARRGHKLLKDKHDELLRRFMSCSKECRVIRSRVDAEIKTATGYMAVACGAMSSEELDIALMMPSRSADIDVKFEKAAGVTVPVFLSGNKPSDVKDIYSYGFAFTPGELDGAVRSYSLVMEDMIKLAQLEKTCQLLSAEIERTRRRVNALEYVMIPQYEDTVRYITMRLDEADRSNATRLLKIKDMMLDKKH